MRVVGVPHPGAPAVVNLVIGHGQHPQMLLWKNGLVVKNWLSAITVADEVVLTGVVAKKTKRSRPPKIKRRPKQKDLGLQDGEKPVVRQRIAAYAVVRSKRGVLGTECSNLTAVPGLWQLPGGGLKPGESPAEAVNREMAEETGQEIVLKKLVELQSDHWVGRAPSGKVEDFHALRIFYTAVCPSPTTPTVIDIDGTTSQAAWIPVFRWRALPWTSGARSVLEKFLSSVRY